MLKREARNTIFYSLWFDQGSNPESTALEAITLTITPPIQLAEIESRLNVHPHVWINVHGSMSNAWLQLKLVLFSFNNQVNIYT